MEKLDIFNQYRPLLFSIAYRMLSSQTDAEDILQEAWIRWQSTNAVVRSPKSFLSSLTTRLCIDQLRSARVKRERYIGTWLPEPLVSAAKAEPDSAELAESLSFAFLTLLECLSPTERAVFLLREVFDFNYADISATVGKSVSNCRQIAHRARQHVRRHRVSKGERSLAAVRVSQTEQADIVAQFMASWYQRDVHRLVTLMAEDVTFFSDGGEQVKAVRKPLHGHQKVARFLVALRRSRLIPPFRSHLVQVNQQSGILNTTDKHTQSIFSFEFSGACQSSTGMFGSDISSSNITVPDIAKPHIQSIFAVVNPQKLKAIRL